jgi:hypothetical protein
MRGVAHHPRASVREGVAPQGLQKDELLGKHGRALMMSLIVVKLGPFVASVSQITIESSFGRPFLEWLLSLNRSVEWRRRRCAARALRADSRAFLIRPRACSNSRIWALR